MSLRLSVQDAVQDQIALIRDQTTYEFVTPPYLLNREDVEGADELGISIEKYLMWKKGFHETYVVAKAAPIESSSTIDNKPTDKDLRLRNKNIRPQPKSKWLETRNRKMGIYN